MTKILVHMQNSAKDGTLARVLFVQLRVFPAVRDRLAQVRASAVRVRSCANRQGSDFSLSIVERLLRACDSGDEDRWPL